MFFIIVCASSWERAYGTFSLARHVSKRLSGGLSHGQFALKGDRLTEDSPYSKRSRGPPAGVVFHSKVGGGT